MGDVVTVATGSLGAFGAFGTLAWFIIRRLLKQVDDERARNDSLTKSLLELAGAQKSFNMELLGVLKGQHP